MRRILAEIQNGQFAKEWITECQAGRPVFKALLAQRDRHLIELVGAKLRAMMPWITKQDAVKPAVKQTAAPAKTNSKKVVSKR